MRTITVYTGNSSVIFEADAVDVDGHNRLVIALGGKTIAVFNSCSWSYWMDSTPEKPDV